MATERKVNLEDRSEFSFRWFAERPAYVNYNNGFVDRTLPIIPKARIGDIACGTGRISSRIFNRYQSAWQEAEIIGVDPDPAALATARQETPSSQNVIVRFEEGKAQDLANFIKLCSVDSVYFCNAIHEIPKETDKLASLVAIFASLKPGGKLFINTAFTSEMFPDKKTFVQWGRLRQRAMELLGKGKDKTKPGFGVYPTEYYHNLLKLAGFIVNNTKKAAVEVISDSIRAISKYYSYIEGQFMDMQDTEKFSLAEKSHALIQAVDDTEKELRETLHDQNAILKLTRIWVEIEAEKPAASK